MWIIFTVFSAAIVMMACELVSPGRQWRPVAGWWARAIALNLVQVAIVFAIGRTWDRWFQSITVFKFEQALGLTGAAVAGYLTITFIYYWWHRARHEVPFLWRMFHQVHHSAQRLEVITSFYKHPAETLANGVLSTVILYALCGLSPQAATLSVLLTGLAELFYHWNVKTPHWIGYIVQRPESHCVHHQKQWHRRNYSDLPLWDMMFGTFHNPRNFDAECGFDTAEERRLLEMLVGVDGNQRPANSRRFNMNKARSWLASGLLIVVGCMQVTGDLIGSTELWALGMANSASPAPKVFTVRDGFEAYSAEFFIRWTDKTGQSHALQITPKTYRGIRGPYNRRNAYGAVLAGAPILRANPATRSMHETATRYALCGASGLLEELGIDRTSIDGPIEVELKPRQHLPTGHTWELTFSETCHAQ